MRHPYLVNCTGHTFRLTGYFPGPRQLNESRCGLRVTRDAFFHTKNDTEFARLALYLSKRQMRVQKAEFPEKRRRSSFIGRWATDADRASFEAGFRQDYYQSSATRKSQVGQRLTPQQQYAVQSVCQCQLISFWKWLIVSATAFRPFGKRRFSI